jgi:uncharacterized protein (DUF58 family)
VWPLGSLAFVEAAATSERALHSAPRRGTGPEFLGVREYRPGDSMRHVHWPSTARTGTVMVREFEEERTRRIAIVVDTVADAGETWTPLDACCSAAASIVLAAAADGQGARVLAPTAHDVEVAAHEDGAASLRRLARLTATGRTLAEAAPELADGLRGAETVVVIAPTWRANAARDLVPALVRLGAAGARVVVLPVVLDPERDGRFAMPASDAEALVADLRRTGSATYPWRRDEDLAGALRAGAPMPAAGAAR